MGTSGIVEPMSEQALIESIYLELNMLAANNTEKTLLITPGNYGKHFVRENTNLNLSRSIKCSNYIGQTLDKAVELGFERILCIGHIGKFIKLAGGIILIPIWQTAVWNCLLLIQQCTVQTAG